MTDASAQRAGLLTARGLLDEALVCLHGLGDPRLPLPSIEACLTGALDRTYEALDAPGEPERYQELCRGALELTREALFFFQDRELRNPALAAPLGLVAQTVGALIEAARTPIHVRRLGPEAPVDPEWSPASFDEPRRIDVDRPVVQVVALIPRPEAAPIEIEAVPEVPEVADDEPVPPVDLDALLAEAEREPGEPAPSRPAPAVEAPAGDADADDERAVFGEALSPQAVLLGHARGFFEDLSMMGLMRRPDAGDAWREMEPIEQRLLARVDAILAAGTWTLAELVGALQDRPMPEPDLLWGALFVYGSLGGEDSVDQVVRLVRTAPLDDEEVVDAVADALSFAANEGVEARLRPWLSEGSPSQQRVALHALARRHALLPEQAVSALSSPDAAVVAEAARALVLMQGPVDRGALAWLLQHADPAVLAAGFRAALLHDRVAAVARAVALTAGGYAHHGEAALVVALGGEAGDLDALLAATQGPPSAPLTEALGWAGRIDAVPYLLDRLEAGDPAALLALQRLTGASLTAEQPAHDPDEPLPFTRDDRLPPAELVLLEDPAAWRAWWAEHGRRPDVRERWQHGRRWTPRDALWELAESASSPRDRTLAWLELRARTGARIPFDAREWVARQRRQVAAWSDYVGVRAAAWPAGTWPTGGLP